MRWTVEYLTLIGPGAARLDLVAPFQHCVSMRRSLKTLTRRPEAQAERPSRAARWPPEGRSHRIAAAEGGGGQQPLPTSAQLCRKVLLWVISLHSALHCRRCTWRATPPHHTARGQLGQRRKGAMRLEMRVAAARCDAGQRSEPVHSALHCRRCTWRATPPHHTARGPRGQRRK